MNLRWVAYAAAVVVLAVTLLSGPLIGAADLSYDRPQFGYTPDENLGDGRVNLTVVRMPDTIYLVKGDYGAESYQLQVPDAQVDVTEVRGHPILTYKIRFPAMNLIRATPTFLSPGDEGLVDLGIASSTYPPTLVNESEYRARLKLLKRENGTMTMIRNESVTVEVVE